MRKRINWTRSLNDSILPKLETKDDALFAEPLAAGDSGLRLAVISAPAARSARARSLCAIAHMQAPIDKWAFFGGFWLSLPAVYLFLGLFSDARWLQPRWGRRSRLRGLIGRPAVVPLSRLSRLLWLLFIGIFAAASFASAFHYDVNSLTSIALPTLTVIFVCMILSGIRDGRNFNGNHDRDA